MQLCTPGMVMSVAATLERNPAATIDEIKHATAGNICRCGAYPHVFVAALRAVNLRRPDPRVRSARPGRLMSRRVTLELGLAGNTPRRRSHHSRRRPAPWQWGEHLSVVGQPAPRADGPLKHRRCAYTYDVNSRDALRRDPAQSVGRRADSQRRSARGGASRWRARGSCS